MVIQGIAGIGGMVEVGEGAYAIDLGHILFNKVPITLLNFFDVSEGVDDIVIMIRQSIASWYYAFRNLAIVASLCILIYTGVKMAMSNIAESKAKYKKMLTNWTVRIYSNIYVALHNSRHNNDK